MKRALPIGFFLFAFLITRLPSAVGQVSTTQPAATLNFFAMGDWGIDSPDRVKTATAMANQADMEGAAGPADVLLLGDNFYVKVSSVDDPLWQSFFEKTYDASKLNVPFYAVLGNHDYKDGNDAVELAYAARGTSRFKMPARHYRLELPPDHPLATILMLDSDQQAIDPDDWKAETAWLESELARPHARWLICCGHHNLFGNGGKGDNGVLITTWGPLFQKYHVDFYICGHEHTLQHLEIPDWYTSFVIAGGGGAGRNDMLRDRRGPFSRAMLGFADIHLTPDSADVSLISGEDGSVVHAFTRDTNGIVEVTKNTASDSATTHPLRTINDIARKKAD